MADRTVEAIKRCVERRERYLKELDGKIELAVKEARRKRVPWRDIAGGLDMALSHAHRRYRHVDKELNNDD